jgi:F0F1-type ATP synthase membrane subunit b/b'
MYERGHSPAAGHRGLREDLGRLEAALAGFEQQLAEAKRVAAPGIEVLTRTAKLLVDEIDRLRAQLG